MPHGSALGHRVSAVNPILSPANATLAQGQTQLFTPTGTGPYTWALQPSPAGSIDSTGLYTAGSPGQAGATDTVTVTDTGAGNTTGTATVTISKGVNSLSNGGGSNGVISGNGFPLQSNTRVLQKVGQTFKAQAPSSGATQGMVTFVALDLIRTAGGSGQNIKAEIHSLTGSGGIDDQGATNAYATGSVSALTVLPTLNLKTRVLIPMTPGTALTVGTMYALTVKPDIAGTLMGYVSATPANDPNGGLAWWYSKRYHAGGFVARGITTSNPADYTQDGSHNISANVFIGEIYSAPTTSSISPTSGTAGGTGFTLTVNGTNFFAASTVKWGGSSRTTSYVSATQLTASITASDIASAATTSVTVTTPAPGGGTSGGQNFTASTATPTVNNITPVSATAGAAGFTLTVNGSGFLSGASVNWAGSGRTTTFVSATQLTATINASDVASAGSFAITANNSGGSASGAQNFLVNPSGAFLLLDASDNSTITKDGSNRVATWADSSGNGYNATQATTSKKPLYGSYTLNGINVLSFTASSSQILQFPTTSALSNLSVFSVYQLPTALTYTTGYYPLNFGSGTCAAGAGACIGIEIGYYGGQSANAFDILGGWNADTRATLTGIAGSGSWQVLDWTSSSTHGSNVWSNGTAATISYPSGSDAAWNIVLGSGSAGDWCGIGGTGNAVDSHQVQYVDSYFAEVRVYNRVLTTSERQLLEGVEAWKWGLQSSLPSGHPWKNATPSNTAPAVTRITPWFALQNASQLTLTVNGSNFNASATVNWGGSARTTTYVSPTQVTATIPSSDFTSTGTPSVTVATSTPSPGGTSNGLTFTVSATNPSPTVTSVSPTWGSAGGSAFTITVSGTNFVATSSVNWAGSARTSTAVSATQLTATINASDITSVGTNAITVTNGTPGGGTSGSVKYYVEPSGTFLFLDAADSTTITKDGSNRVATWADKSGNGYNATQATSSKKPNYGSVALNSNTVLSFTASSSQILQFPTTSALSNLSVFSVYQLPTALTYTTGYYPLNFGSGTCAAGAGACIGIEIGYYGGQSANAFDILGGWNADTRATLTGIAGSGSWQVLDWTSSSTHGSNVWSNGTAATISYPSGSDAAWNIVLGSGSAGDWCGIGGTGNAVDSHQVQYVDSYFAEVRVFNRVVTTSERQFVEGELAWKWGLQGSLPSGHPYKNAAP